jgi:DNA-binding LacI/PurR family transcriptional regulator
LNLIKNQDKKFLLNDICSKIDSNELKEGEKLLSTKELARKYGIAIQTAHLLLKELTEEGLLFRKKGVGTFIKGRKNTSVSGVVGLIMACNGDIWAEFTSAIVSGLQTHNINTVLIDVDSTTQSLAYMRDHPAVKKLISNNPLGIITYDTELGNSLADGNPGIKVIDISGENISPMTKMDIVCPDLFHAGYIGTSHLIKLGHKHISFYKIKTQEKAITSRSRELFTLCDGYRKALSEAGLNEDVFVDSADGLDDMNMFCDRLTSREKMDAILVNFDHRATQLVQKAAEKGIKVPDDLAIVSAYNTPWAESFQLTSLDYHYELIANKCVQLILEYMNYDKGINSRQIIKFEPELVVRKSCGNGITEVT